MLLLRKLDSCQCAKFSNGQRPRDNLLKRKLNWFDRAGFLATPRSVGNITWTSCNPPVGFVFGRLRLQSVGLSSRSPYWCSAVRAIPEVPPILYQNSSRRICRTFPLALSPVSSTSSTSRMDLAFVSAGNKGCCRLFIWCRCNMQRQNEQRHHVKQHW